MYPDGQNLKSQQFEVRGCSDPLKREPGSCEPMAMTAGIGEGVVEYLPNVLFDDLFAMKRDITVDLRAGAIRVKDTSFPTGLKFRLAKQFFFPAKTKDSQVIKAHDMIGMGMSKDRCTNH